MMSTKEALSLLNWAEAGDSTLEGCLPALEEVNQRSHIPGVNRMVYALDRGEDKFIVCNYSIST